MKHTFILFCILTLFIQFCKKADNITPPEDPEYSDLNWIKIQARNSPPERAYHRMAYDSESDRVILFGGQNSPSWPFKDYLDTWAYDHNSAKWTNLEPQIKPSWGSSMAYDAESDRIILFSNWNGTNPLTWIYDYNTNTWTWLHPSEFPPKRLGNEMVYDAESDRIILFGGWYDNAPLNDTWSYDLNTNTWTEMKPPINPPARLFHSMAYDTESDRIILFGGGYAEEVNVWTKLFDDTWAYDYNSNTWSQLDPGTSPSPRIYSDMTYDVRDDRIILFGGGTQSYTGQIPGPYGNETWQYDFNSNEWEEINIDRKSVV